MGIFERQLTLRQAAKSTSLAIVLLSLFYASTASLADDNQPILNDNQTITTSLNADPGRYLYFGDCKIPTDPTRESAISGQKVCVRGSAGAAAHVSSHRPEDAITSYGKGYAGLHFSDALSLHLSGRMVVRRSITDGHRNHPAQSEFDEASVRIGNRALHQITITGGYQSLPFGLNLYAPSEVQPDDPSAHFWKSEKLGAYATWQEDFDLRIDLGASTQPSPKLNPESSEQAGVAARVIKAVSSLDGTEFMGSIYAKNQGLRRIGVALLNTSRRGEKTGIEWIREIASPRHQRPFQQIVRISYVGTRKKRDLWHASYDHILYHSRSGEFGDNLKLNKYLSALFALRYTASDLETMPSHWTFSTGVVGEL